MPRNLRKDPLFLSTSWLIRSLFQVPVSDLFTFETSEIRISRVSIYYSALPTKFLEHSMRTVLRIPGDRRALDAKVSLPLSGKQHHYVSSFLATRVDLLMTSSNSATRCSAVDPARDQHWQKRRSSCQHRDPGAQRRIDVRSEPGYSCLWRSEYFASLLLPC